MKRKILYALALLLCLSTVALSNERSRFWCGVTGKICPNNPPKTPAKGKTSHDASATEENGTSGSHIFLHTFIKLLYI